MRFTCVRWLIYGVALGVPALAQPPTLISREMPHVEISAGVGAVSGGPSRQVERQLTRLGLDRRDGLLKRPHTSLSEFPPAFAQVHVGVSRNVTVGGLVSTFEHSTVGRDAEGGLAHVYTGVLSRAVVVSYRPNPWIRVGAGPALHRRTVEFPLADRLIREQRLGWVAGGDVKIARRPLSYQHPPTFGYVTAQYRGSPSLRVPPGPLPLSGFDRRSVPWPGQRVRTSHWMVGIGVGFEI